MIREGYEVIGIEYTAEKAIEITNTEFPDLVIMDIRLMGDMDGIEAAKIINVNHDIPIIFITGFSIDDLKEKLQGISNAGIINKPIRFEELLHCANMVVV